MAEPRYINLTVEYDRRPGQAGSLTWIAPALNESGLMMIEGYTSCHRFVRRWTGVVDGRTFGRFADDWRLPDHMRELTRAGPGTDDAVANHAYTLDGMNWEAHGESPIICASIEVMPARRRTMTGGARPARAQR